MSPLYKLTPPNGFYREAKEIIERLDREAKTDAERKMLLYKELQRLFSETSLSLARAFLNSSMSHD